MSRPPSVDGAREVSWNSAAICCSGCMRKMSVTGCSGSRSPAGAMSTSRSTRDGASTASSAASQPPNDTPTTVAEAMPSSSSRSS